MVIIIFLAINHSNGYIQQFKLQDENLYVNQRLQNSVLNYGFEFIAAEAGALVSHFSLYSFNTEEQWKKGPERWFSGIGYALLTTTTSTAATHLTGKLFNQKGNWYKAAIGAGIASIFVSFIEYNYHRFGVEYTVFPAYGAVVGYNWDSNKFFRQTGIYTFEGMGGCIGLGLSFLSSIYFYSFNYEYIEPQNIIPLYTASNMLFTSTTTTITGKLFKERGSWWKSAIGAGIGALISSAAFSYYESSNSKPWPRIIGITITLLPPAGAVLGYNLH